MPIYDENLLIIDVQWCVFKAFANFMIFMFQATRNITRPGKVVARILADKGIIRYCLEFLESLLPYWRQVKATSNVSNEDFVCSHACLLFSYPFHTVPYYI